MLITKKRILKDSKFGGNLFASLIFIIGGVLIWFAPFTVKDLDRVNLIASIIFLSVFVLFFVILGLNFLINALKLRISIRKEKFYILSDTIVDKTISTSDEVDYELKLRKFRKKVYVMSSQYRKVKEKDKCILIFINEEKYPTFVYPGNDYIIDESLKEHIVDSIEKI